MLWRYKMADLIKMKYGDEEDSLELTFDRDKPEDIEIMLEIIMMHTIQTDKIFKVEITPTI